MGDRKKIVLECENETRITFDPVDSTLDGDTLYDVEVDGFVTWAEMEAAILRLHPKQIDALEHAQAVRDADTWEVCDG